LGVALCGLGATIARGQSRGTLQVRVHNSSVSITVPASAFDQASGQAVVTVPRAVLAEVHATRPWILRVRSDRAKFSTSSGNSDKPCTDLAIRATGLPGFRPLSTTAAPVLTGDKTQGWVDVSFDLRFTALLTDAAGTYTLNLLFDFQ
jgi:hypothetical protein